MAFVTDMDLRIRGRGRFTLEGRLRVHEQIHIEQNPTIVDQVTVDDGLVTTNQVIGRSTITYNGGTGTRLAVTAWREVR